MSFKAMAWAVEQKPKSSAQKFVLVAFANFATDGGLSYPAVSTVCAMTLLHDETVRGSVKALEILGFMHDTGKRVGSTQQVKVYQLPNDACVVEPKTPENRGLKDSGKTRERLGKDPYHPPAEPRTENQVPIKSLKRFNKPTFPEMELYASKIGLPPTEINGFYDHFETNGWKVGRGGLPMRDWQSAMRTWNSNFRKWDKPNGHRSNNRGVGENPRNVGIVKGPTDYVAAAKRKAEATAKAAVAGCGSEAESGPPATKGVGESDL